MRMDVVVVRQFLNFFQDFIDFCQWKDWPSNETTEDDIKNAFTKARHIEQCLDTFQRNKTLNEFLATINNSEDSEVFLKACLTEPYKYILKKILNSNTKVVLMDTAFKLFLQLFPEEKLEIYLTDLIVEASSKQLLLKKISTEIPKDKVLKFKSKILLSQLNDESKESLREMFNNCDQEFVDVIVVSLCSTDSKFQRSVKIVSACCLEVLLSKSNHFKRFWRLLFNVEDKYLINMCLENCDIYTHISEGLVDCGKLLKENMSAEYFYIEFTYSELAGITRRLFASDFLKAQFVNILNNHDTDQSFWQQFL